MRLLFASTAGAGHFRPIVPWVELATARGHEVLVVGPAELAELAAPRFPFQAGPAPDPALAPDMEQLATMTHEAAAPFMVGEVFARYNSGALLPLMRQICEEWGPDAVFRDPTEFASACAATAAGVPQVRVGHGLAAGEQSMLGYASGVLDELEPGTTAAVQESPYLTMWPAELDPPVLGTTVRYRETPVPTRDRGPERGGGADGPLVYVTFGTVGPRMPELLPLYRHALAACAGLQAEVVMTVGHELDVTALGPVPGNARVLPWVDQDSVLSAASVVLSHGGSGTVLGALAAGCPQVVLPLFADQAANARAVADAGLGVALQSAADGGAPAIRVPGEADVEPMRRALQHVLSDPRYAAAAAAVARSMTRLPLQEDVARQVAEGF